MIINCRVHALNTDGKTHHVRDTYCHEADSMFETLYYQTSENVLHWKKLDADEKYKYVYSDHEYIYGYGTELGGFYVYLYEELVTKFTGVALVSSSGALHLFSKKDDLLKLVEKKTAPETEGLLFAELKDLLKKLDEDCD